MTNRRTVRALTYEPAIHETEGQGVSFDEWLNGLAEATTAKHRPPKPKPNGKNFSCTNRGQRKANDFYETPFSLTRQFLELGLLDPAASTLEPASGAGAIVRILQEQGFSKISAYDAETDFLKETTKYSQIITNPPFSLTQEFIMKAKQVATQRFALLLPLNYLHGKTRYEKIFRDSTFPLASVNVFIRYPFFGDALRADGKYKTGMMVCAWYVWDISHYGSAKIGWIDNTKYVLDASDKSNNLTARDRKGFPHIWSEKAEPTSFTFEEWLNRLAASGDNYPAHGINEGAAPKQWP
jgi:hypothetical protein